MGTATIFSRFPSRLITHNHNGFFTTPSSMPEKWGKGKGSIGGAVIDQAGVPEFHRDNMDHVGGQIDREIKCKTRIMGTQYLIHIPLPPLEDIL